MVPFVLKNKYVFCAGVVLVAAFLFVIRAPASQEDTTVVYRKQESPEGPFVRVGDVEIPVELAQSPTEVTRGLSGRASLEPDRGMLFIFSKPDRYRFWMPDMHFPIDIVWIAGGAVVDIDENVSNEFDPAHPRFYTPSRPVDRVLEVNAGFARAHGIGVGSAASIRHIE